MTDEEHKEPTGLMTVHLRGKYPTAVMDSNEAAAYLGISTRGLYRLVRRGEVPHTRVGRAIRYRIVDLDAYLEENTSRTWERVDDRGRPAAEDADEE